MKNFKYIKKKRKNITYLSPNLNNLITINLIYPLLFIFNVKYFKVKPAIVSYYSIFQYASLIDEDSFLKTITTTPLYLIK